MFRQPYIYIYIYIHTQNDSLREVIVYRQFADGKQFITKLINPILILCVRFEILNVYKL